MPDTTFETLLSGQLRAYAETGVRPIDRFAIAEETITSGRTTPRWRRGWGLAPMRRNRILIPLLVGLLLAALAGGALLVGSRLQAPPELTLDAAFSRTGAPQIAREFPTVVSLPDGRVLVTGGTKTVEAWDPSTGEFSPVGSLLEPRTFESAVLLRDGRVLFYGGLVTQAAPSDPLVASTTAELFDPISGTSTLTGSPMVHRELAAAALLADGRVLVSGGVPDVPSDVFGGDAMATAEIYDPATGRFSPTGSMTEPRASHHMNLLPDGRVLVMGGVTRNDGGTSLASAELFDPRSGTFTPTGSMARERAATARSWSLPDGRVLIATVAGDIDQVITVEVYDPATAGFSTAVTLPHTLQAAAVTADGRLFATGTWSDGAAQRPPSLGGPRQAWAGIFDPGTGVMRQIDGAPAGTQYAVLMTDGRVMLLNGDATSVELFDPSALP